MDFDNHRHVVRWSRFFKGFKRVEYLGAEVENGRPFIDILADNTIYEILY